MHLAAAFLPILLGMDSKKDKNIIFCSTEERDAYEARLKQTTPGKYPDVNDSSHEKKSTGESGGQYQDSDSATRLAQSQIVDRPFCERVPMLSPGTLMKTRTMLAQRLLCPTHSRRSKSFKAENMKRRKRRMSDIAVKSTVSISSILCLIVPTNFSNFVVYIHLSIIQ